MKIKGLILVILIAATGISFSSCKKTCVLEDGKDSGKIIAEQEGYTVVIYPRSGYMSGNLGGDYHVHAGHPYANSEDFEVSFDDGYTREAVDFSIYNILAYPITVNCKASFDRNVFIDPATQTATYSITVTECSKCDEKYTTENYVLVPAFPETYTVIYDVKVNTVD